MSGAGKFGRVNHRVKKILNPRTVVQIGIASLCIALVPSVPSDAATEFKLPWRGGAMWYMTQGLHEARGFDFAPGGGGSKNDEVVATESGIAKLRCGPDSIGQAAVTLQTAAGTFEYWHLQGSAVLAAGITSGGIQVAQGQVLGRLYPSVGSFDGPCGNGNASHLHFVVPALPTTIQGIVFSASGPARLTRVTSNNGETLSPESPDLVSPGSVAFTQGGTPSGWSSVSNGGISGRAIFTYVNNSGRDNWARWTFDLGALGGNGNYRIETFIPTANAGTTNARYQINTSTGIQSSIINQRLVSGWQSLGTFNMSVTSAWIELDDNTGEPTVKDQNHQIAFDSMRLIFMEPSKLTITAVAGANGAISPAGDSKVVSGENQSYSITPASGYHTSKITVDGKPVAIANTYSFTAVVDDHTIAAEYSPDIISTRLTGSIPSRVAQGARVTLLGTALKTPSAGKVQINWKLKVGGKYIDVYADKVSIVNGKYRHSKVLPTSGTWLVAAQYIGSGVAPIYKSSNVFSRTVIVLR